MATTLSVTLSETVITQLQSLIRANTDSYNGYEEAADDVSDPNLSAMFRELAFERSAMASELRDYVEWNGAAAPADGTTAGIVHRTWLAIRALVTQGSPEVILAEVEVAEAEICRAYAGILEASVGQVIHIALQNHYELVQKAYENICELREAYACRPVES